MLYCWLFEKQGFRKNKSLGFLTLFFSYKVRRLLIWSRVGETDRRIGLKKLIHPSFITIHLAICVFNMNSSGN